jgi:hypothetical protein
MGASEGIGDGGGWVGVDGHDKGFACECVMDFRQNGEG